MDIKDQFNSQIQSILPWIVSNFAANPESCQKSKDLLHNMVFQLEDPNLSIQKLYLSYFICEMLTSHEEEVAINFFKTLFPMPLRKNIAAFITQLVSLAISIINKQVLTASTIYIEKEQIKLSDEDIRHLPSNLAEISPSFAAVLIDKGFFNLASAKTNLSRWLVNLNECNSNQAITFNGQALIRYALLGQGQGNSDLHYNILDAIQNKRLQPLSNQFIIDIATQLSQRGDEDLNLKFAQILINGVHNGICNNLVSSNQMKSTLFNLFPTNILIKAIVTMKGPK